MHTYLSDMQRSAHTRSTRNPRQVLQTIGAAALLSILAACGGDLGEEKLKTIPPGANREAVLSTMGAGPLVATQEFDRRRVVNGFRAMKFITQGRTIEVLWYREQPGSLEDVITQKTETPVVIEADTLVGWGWKFYHPFAVTMKLPDPIKDAARIDSMSKAQQPKGA